MRRTAASLLLLLPVLAVPLPAAAALDPDLLAGLEVRSIGPSAMSGRVTSIVGVASDPAVLYTGTAAGGVWKSVNAGISWTPIFDEQRVASIGDVAVFQPNPALVWVGTGEANVRNSVSAGGGVFLSRDAGQTFKLTGLIETERISRVVLHPTDPDVAWVAALGKLWGENPERGVFKTTDGGRSWKKVLYVDTKTGAADLVIDPRNPDKLIAAMWDHRRWPWTFRSGGRGSGLYVTEDGGESWTRRTEDDGLPAGNLGRIGLAISPSEPRIVYALVEAKKSMMLRSEDGGRTFKDTGAPERVANRPFYYNDIRVDPQWPNRVYSLATRFTVSNDSGKSFDRLGGSNEIHSDFHALWIHPENPEYMVVGNDGGLAVSRDRGETWAFVANLPVAQYYHVAVDNERPYNVYGGLQDNGSWRGPSSVREQGGIRNDHWLRIGGGDGFDAQPDPEDAMRGYAMSQSGFLTRYDLRTGEMKSVKPPEIDPKDRLRFNWNSALALDPFAPGTLYYGSQYVHKSTDRGNSWAVVSPDLTTDNPEWQKTESGGLTPDETGAETFTSLVALAASPRQQGVLWAGSDDGRIHVTRDGAKTWTSVEKNVRGVPANTWIPHIRPSKFEAAGAFVVFDNHRRGDFAPYVYRTDDYGQTWKSLVTPNLSGWALSIEQDPVDPDLLFLGTEFGLWLSQDGGKSWLRFNHGIPSTPVADLVIHPRDHDLVIATHGRAIYILDDVSPLRTLSEETMKKPLSLLTVASSDLYRNRLPSGVARGAGASDFEGKGRPLGAIVTYSLNQPGLPHPLKAKERERKEKERTDAANAAEAAEAAAAAEMSEQPMAKSPVPPTAATATAGGAGGEGEGEKKGSDEPEVEIRITDSEGKLVRKMKGPARQGVNRAVWGLDRDAFKRPPQGERGGPQRDGGPSVPPGTYTVAVRYGKEEAKTTVEVKPDPLIRTTPEGWAAREKAIRRCGALQDALVTAIERVRETRDEVDTVLAKLKKAKGEDEESEADKALGKEGRELKKRLTEVEKLLFTSPETKGIVDNQSANTKVGLALNSLDSSWDAPTGAHLENLKIAEDAVAEVLPKVNQLLAGDVAAFQKKAAERGLGLLAAGEAITVK